MTLLVLDLSVTFDTHEQNTVLEQHRDYTALFRNRVTTLQEFHSYLSGRIPMILLGNIFFGKMETIILCLKCFIICMKSLRGNRRFGNWELLVC